MATIFTCKGCPDRYPGCHDHCDKYKREKAEYEKRKAELEADREARIYTGNSIFTKQNYLAKKQKEWRRYGRYK